MRKFLQNKLWRDKVLENLEKMGSIIHWSRLEDAEYDRELRNKLAEEADEVRLASTREELINELADVYEVIDALCALHGVTESSIRATQENKRNQRGGFSGRKFVTLAEHPEGSFGEKYCLADPTKYPEIPCAA